MNATSDALWGALIGGSVASIAPVVGSIVTFLGHRQDHYLNVKSRQEERDDLLDAKRQLLYEDCLRSAGEFIGQIDRAQHGDRVAFTNARESRGAMIAAWTKYLRHGSAAEKGIIRHFLSSISQPLENGELYEATCSAVIQLADIANPDFGRQAVVVSTKTSLLVISPDAET